MTRSELNVLKYLVNDINESYQEHERKFKEHIDNEDSSYVAWYESGAVNALKPVVQMLNSFIASKEK